MHKLVALITIQWLHQSVLLICSKISYLIDIVVAVIALALLHSIM